MATREVTEANFAETIRKGIVLLDFWAAWCAPCRAFAPVFEAAALRHPDVIFGKVDTEAEQGRRGLSGPRDPDRVGAAGWRAAAAQPGAMGAAMLDEPWPG